MLRVFSKLRSNRQQPLKSRSLVCRWFSSMLNEEVQRTSASDASVIVVSMVSNSSRWFNLIANMECRQLLPVVCPWLGYFFHLRIRTLSSLLHLFSIATVPAIRRRLFFAVLYVFPLQLKTTWCIVWRR